MGEGRKKECWQRLEVSDAGLDSGTSLTALFGKTEPGLGKTALPQGLESCVLLPAQPLASCPQAVHLVSRFSSTLTVLGRSSSLIAVGETENSRMSSLAKKQ